jgi:hypothetical protein
VPRCFVPLSFSQSVGRWRWLVLEQLARTAGKCITRICTGSADCDKHTPPTSCTIARQLLIYFVKMMARLFAISTCVGRQGGPCRGWPEQGLSRSYGLPARFPASCLCLCLARICVMAPEMDFERLLVGRLQRGPGRGGPGQGVPYLAGFRRDSRSRVTASVFCECVHWPLC